MRRKPVEPVQRTWTGPRGSLRSLTLAVTAPPAGLPVDERASEEHRPTQDGGYLGNPGLDELRTDKPPQLHLASAQAA